MKLKYYDNEYRPCVDFRVLKNAEPSTYTFTNENLAGFVPKFVAGAKSGVVVCASGDQIINSANEGVRDFVAFDVNAYAMFWTELKLRALAEFDYAKFLEFFTANDKSTVLPINFFENLKSGIDPVARDFWEAEYKNDIPFIKRYSKVYEKTDPMLLNNTYLQNEKSYETAREKIADINIDFLNTGVNNLPNLLGKRHFDFALLSNIADRYPSNVAGYFHQVGKPLLRNCDKIQFAYLWDKKDRKSLLPAGAYKTINQKGFGVKHMKFPQSPLFNNRPDGFDCAVIIEHK